MTDNTLMWINRITVLIFYCVGIYICEKFNLKPAACYTIGIFYLIGMNFLVEIIRMVLK